jgi:hypothetical protein
MGIDVDYWLVVRSGVRLAPVAPPGELSGDPEEEATHLASTLVPSRADSTSVGWAYIKNSYVPEVADAFEGLAREAVRSEHDRVLLFHAIDGEHGFTSWRIDGPYDAARELRRRDGVLRWDEMDDVFVPNEPATHCLVFTDRGSDAVDVRLAKSLDAELKQGLKDCLGKGGAFFWEGPVDGLHGVAVAVQKFVSSPNGCGDVVFVYRTEIEGTFAFACRRGREWPRHVRMNVSFVDAPGDLAR